MSATLTELAGFFVIIIGVGAIIGAAAMISLVLAVLAFGVFAVFGGIVLVIFANKAAATQKANPVR